MNRNLWANSSGRSWIRQILLLLTVLGLVGIESPAFAQAGSASSSPSEAQAQVTEMTGGSGLPERAAPPRTLRAYWHVFGAFAATWLLLFGYALSLGKRFGQMEQEVRRSQGG